MKRTGRKIVCLVFVALFILLAVWFVNTIVHSIIDSFPIKLEFGWQKIETVDGVIPEGVIMVVSSDSNLIIPSDSETRSATGYISEGTVTFYKNTRCFSEKAVWIYKPDEYEFLLKIDDFSSQCDKKLSDLKGTDSQIKNNYLLGH